MKDVQKPKEHTVPKEKAKIDLTSGCLRTAAVIGLEMKNWGNLKDGVHGFKKLKLSPIGSSFCSQ